ncbi:hypothetical protein [Phreatobacter sp.]|uniref:hypothetical protein n=1 Tax=Phreatobacter sp. TaxID=1966341 RepID=UPI003F704AB6
MHRFILTAAILATGLSGAAAQSGPAAIDLIRPVYQSLARDQEPQPTPMSREASIRQRFYTPRVVNLWRAAERCEQRSGNPAVDADPWVQGQDHEIRNVQFQEGPVRDGRQEITVRFRNFGAPSTVRFRMEMTPAGWRIDDVAGAGPSLAAMLRGACARR